jgi:long-chain acyl-CoA synthetase
LQPAIRHLLNGIAARRGRRNGAEVPAEALTELCRRELAEYKAPAAFRFVTEFPLGVTGKVDKKALKAQWTQG